VRLDVRLLFVQDIQTAADSEIIPQVCSVLRKTIICPILSRLTSLLPSTFARL